MKISYDVNEIRIPAIMLGGLRDVDSKLNFFYDETNNVKKLRLRDYDFNHHPDINFVLGGIVCEDTALGIDISKLKEDMKLQKTVKEIKFDHVAHGNLEDCLKSEKLKIFFKFLLDNNLYVHYTAINLLYFSIVDIVDSALAAFEGRNELGMGFDRLLKDVLCRLIRLEIDSAAPLFYKYGYPNIKEDDLITFVDELVALFHKYESILEYHLGLVSLRQLLTAAAKKGELVFIMDETDNELIKTFAHFYIQSICIFKNATHSFDNESDIIEYLKEYSFEDNSKPINTYSFVDSKSEPYIQLSDVFVGFIGKYYSFLTSKTREEIVESIMHFSCTQRDNLAMGTKLIRKSGDYNLAFFNEVMCNEDLQKSRMVDNIIRQIY